MCARGKKIADSRHVVGNVAHVRFTPRFSHLLDLRNVMVRSSRNVWAPSIVGFKYKTESVQEKNRKSTGKIRWGDTKASMLCLVVRLTPNKPWVFRGYLIAVFSVGHAELFVYGQGELNTDAIVHPEELRANDPTCPSSIHAQQIFNLTFFWIMIHIFLLYATLRSAFQLNFRFRES